ncbi:hypothetical protein [Qingshengfaniella alkalisoli]|uniref:hypothetical protein n=1 Tax=Qingshengfaniella alkalisoli TaxID=2599296 RepID=UPI00143DC007|nr:hypothetical protein [Qingshengfaniella alkalisoli]
MHPRSSSIVMIATVVTVVYTHNLVIERMSTSPVFSDLDVGVPSVAQDTTHTQKVADEAVAKLDATKTRHLRASRQVSPKTP